MAVTHRDTLGVVTALRTDNVVNLLGHQLRQHSETDADAQRQQPFLRGAGKLAERDLHAFGQRLELRSPISSAALSTFLMAVLLSS